MYWTVVVILIQHQILVTNLLRNIKELEGRINNLILGVKGSVDMQSWLIFKSNLFLFFSVSSSVVSALVAPNIGFQLQYQLIFVLWLLSFDPRIVERMIG